MNQDAASPIPALVVDRQRRSVRLAGQPVALGGRAFDVLAALTARPGQVCSVQSLHEAVWPDAPVEPNNVRVQIATLRQRLGARHIDNVPGRGYRWIGPVQALGPAPGPELIGRDEELRALQGLAAQHRLVSVLGAGGIGKTALVRAWRRDLQAAVALPSAPATVLVELAPLTGRGEVLAALARAFEPALPLSAPLPTELAGLSAALATPNQGGATGAAPPPLPTLILDNAEHLVADVAPIVQALLDAVPALRIIVTSQLPLRLPGEQALRLSPLELPERGVTLGQARAVGALVLFAERVHALDPRFELNAGNLATVADICCRLDGLPLAIELAAARVPAIGLQALQRALGERLGALTGGPGHGPVRQRTLRAALDWSYGLLDAATQQVFCRLGTFAGTFTLAQAQRALAPSRAEHPDWSVIDAITRLVEASLVGQAGGDPPRYQLLELPREFALERLGGDPPTADRPNSVETSSPLLQRLVRRIDPPVRAKGFDARSVLALAQRLQPDELRQFDTALQELQRAVDLAGSVVAEGGDEDDAATGDGVEQVLTAVAEQTRRGHLDRAVDELDAALADLNRREERRQAAALRSRRALLGAGVRQELLRRDPLAAAQRIEALVALDHPARPAWSASFLAHETDCLTDGMQPGHLLPLAVGVALARRRLATAEDAAERLAVQRVLATALTEQGKRESTHASLQEAVQMCRLTLEATDRASAPLAWAARQHDLGHVLNTLSYRTGDLAMMEEADARTLDALQERTAGHTPRDWADSQRQRVEILRNLGQREASNRRLHDAVAASHAGLQACPASLAPLLHSQLQDGLATTLIVLGRRESSAALLKESVAASRRALAVVSRRDAPRRWGDSHSHLGLALGMLGEADLEPDAALATQALQEAVAAYGEALSVVTPDTDPVRHAMGLHNRAGVLRQIGLRARDIQQLEESARGFAEALTHFPQDRFPMYWAAAQDDLASTLHSLAQLQPPDLAALTLARAAEAAGCALQERTRERSPLEWAQTQGQLALIWFETARCGGDPAQAHAALAAWHDTLPVLDADGAAAHRAQTLGHIAEARAWLGARAGVETAAGAR